MPVDLFYLKILHLFRLHSWISRRKLAATEDCLVICGSGVSGFARSQSVLILNFLKNELSVEVSSE